MLKWVHNAFLSPHPLVSSHSPSQISISIHLSQLGFLHLCPPPLYSLHLTLSRSCFALVHSSGCVESRIAAVLHACVCVGLSERFDVGMKNTKIITQLINVSHFTRMMNLQRVALNHACDILSFTSLIHLPLSVLFVSSSPGRLEITGVLLQATDRCCLLMHDRRETEHCDTTRMLCEKPCSLFFF